MVVADFRQLGGQERGFSDIAPAKAAVASPAGVGAVQNIASAFQVVESGLKIGMEISGAQKESAQNEALARGKSAFEDQLVRASMMLEQGKGSTEVRQATTKWFNASELPFDVKAKMMKSWESISLGKSFNEPTEAEREANQLEQILIDNKYILPGADEGEIGLAAIEFDTDSTRARMLKLEGAEVDATLKRAELPKAEREEALLRKKEIVKGNLAHLVETEPKKIDRTLKALLGKFNSGGFSDSPAENEQMYQLAVDQEAQAFNRRTNLVVLEDPQAAEPFKAIIDESLGGLFKLYKDKVNTLQLATNAESQLRLLSGKNKLLLLSDESTAIRVAASEMVNHQNATLTKNIQTDVNKKIVEIEKAAAEDRQFNNLHIDDEGSVPYLDTLTTGMGAVYQFDSQGKPMANAEQQAKHLNQTLGYLGDRSSDDNTHLVNFLSTPEAAKFMADHPVLINQDSVDKAVKAMQEYGVRMKEVSNKSLGSIPTAESLEASRAKILAVNPATKFDETRRGMTTDDIEMEVTGGRVLFIATHPRADSKVEELNQSLAKPYTTFFRAQSALQPQTSIEKISERGRALIWPQKYGENAGETPAVRGASPEESQDVTALSKGTVIIDEEGNRFSSDGNGGFTQIRSAPNAASR